MLAFAWSWKSDEGDGFQGIAKRLGNALCSGIGGSAATVDAGGVHFAYRPLRPDPVISRNWRPADLPGGRLATFHGYFDNAEALADELGCDENALSLLYGLAVEKWGEDADRRIIGEYCAIIVDRHSRKVRLSRSPLRAPPLPIIPVTAWSPQPAFREQF